MSATNPSSPAPAIPATQFLAFTLAGSEYAIELLRVREILQYSPPTRVPTTPPFVRGVINLRGSVLPVVDLRTKLGLPAATETSRACIAVAEVEAGWEETVRLGLLVDAVNDIVELTPADIESPPPFGTQIKLEFLRGVGKKNQNLYLVLELDRVLSPEELAAVDEAAGAPTEGAS